MRRVRDKRDGEEISREIMRRFAESDVRSESDAFTTRSKISRTSLDNQSQFLSRNARTLSTPAGFISPEFLFGAAVDAAAAAAAATADLAADLGDLSRLNGTRSRILQI